MTVIVDTPDYQRGVVNAQILLGVMQAGFGGIVVQIPPNAETLIVAASAASTLVPLVTGQESGITYAGTQAQGPEGIFATPVFLFDISSVLDPTVEVSFDADLLFPWYVYSDSAARVIVDVSKVTNSEGVQYVVPTIPSLATGDHPPNEVHVLSNGLSASGAMIAAPGAGKRLRIFSAQMGCLTAGVGGVLEDAAGGVSVALNVAPGTSTTDIPEQGYPITANTALTYALLAGAGTMYIVVYYTIENV